MVCYPFTAEELGPREQRRGMLDPVLNLAEKSQVECRDRTVVGMWSQHIADVSESSGLP